MLDSIIHIYGLITTGIPRITQFYKRQEKIIFFETRADFVLVGMTVHSDEVGGGILLGDNPSCEAFELRPVRLQYDGFWISNELSCIYRYVFDRICVGRDSAVGI